MLESENIGIKCQHKVHQGTEDPTPKVIMHNLQDPRFLGSDCIWALMMSPAMALMMCTPRSLSVFLQDRTWKGTNYFPF